MATDNYSELYSLQVSDEVQRAIAVNAPDEYDYDSSDEEVKFNIIYIYLLYSSEDRRVKNRNKGTK